MSLSSMTGFGRAAGRHGRLRWNWEAKSVNARSLDVRIRVASGYDRLEIPARKSVVEILGRGSISLILTIEVEREETKLKINQQFVKQVLELQKELEGRVSPEPPRIETLLNVKGATEICESETSDAVIAGIDAKILSSLNDALSDLRRSRSEEGDRLEMIIEDQLSSLENLRLKAHVSDGGRVERIRDRISVQLSELVETPSVLSEERLAQEVAILAMKADVREEIDRIAAHCEAMRELLVQSEPVGRRLDFLCQELIREANTLCSKSTTEELTKIGLAAKFAIDQIREQAQNVE